MDRLANQISSDLYLLFVLPPSTGAIEHATER